MRVGCKIVVPDLVLALMLVLAGCSKVHIFCNDDGTDGVYLLLNVNIGERTRADVHPYGGEDGDGREGGRNHENEVSDIMLFIYHGSGINDPDDTQIKASKYYDKMMFVIKSDSYTTLPVKLAGYQPEEGDRIIVLANVGDRSGLATLGEVRDALLTSAWTSDSDIRNFSHFAMTSALDDNVQGKMMISGRTGLYGDPFTASVTVERVAARFDIWLKKQSAGVGEPIVYESTDGSGKLKLSHIRLVNASCAGAYMLKRTSSSVNPVNKEDCIYLGKETVSSGTHIPTNYVVEPNTGRKHSTESVSDADLADWYGESSLKNSLGTDFLNDDAYRIHGCAADPQVFSVPEDADVDGDGSAEGDIYCYILGYSLENTMDITGQEKRFMTGLELKGTFVPNTVYKLDGHYIVEDDGYAEGDDLWLYKEPGNSSSYMFFSSEAAMDAYRAGRSGNTHVLYHYINAECYYYVWIRHAMYNVPDYKSGTYPMEYATVRNNIYRIGVNSVTSIGTPLPDPDSGVKTGIIADIYVRKWRFRQESEIVL